MAPNCIQCKLMIHPSVGGVQCNNNNLSDWVVGDSNWCQTTRNKVEIAVGRGGRIMEANIAALSHRVQQHVSRLCNKTSSTLYTSNTVRRRRCMSASPVCWNADTDQRVASHYWRPRLPASSFTRLKRPVVFCRIDAGSVVISRPCGDYFIDGPVFTQEQVFGPRTAKFTPIWIKICIYLLLYGIHLWADLDRDRRMGGCRPNQKTMFFSVILVTHPKSYIDTTDRHNFGGKSSE